MLAKGNSSLFDWSRKMNRPLILDGAMGSILQSRYPSLHHHGIWMNRVLTVDPTYVQHLHEEYIEAGADIITTFTFRTCPYSLKINDPDQNSSSDLVKIAVECSKKAVSKVDTSQNCLKNEIQAEECEKIIEISGLINKSEDELKTEKEVNDKKIIKSLEQQVLKGPVLIAGSNTTMVDCYVGDISKHSDEEIYVNHEEHINHLISNGVDFILNETLGFYREIIIICKICSSKNIPFIISFYCDSDLKLLSGENLIDAVEEVKKYNPMAISFNCIKYSSLSKIINTFNLADYPWGCYVNCGDEDMQEKFSEHDGEVEGTHVLDVKITPDQLASFADLVRKKGLRPAFIGSCCCSTPEHTKRLKEIIERE